VAPVAFSARVLLMNISFLFFVILRSFLYSSLELNIPPAVLRFKSKRGLCVTLMASAACQ